MKNLLVLASIGLTVACSPTNESGLHLEGTIQGGDTLYISQIRGTGTVILDTVYSEDGELDYTIPTTSDTLHFYNLEFPSLSNIRIGGKTGETLHIDGNVKQDLAQYTISGNETSVKLKRLYDVLYRTMEVVDSLGVIVDQYRDSANSTMLMAQINGKYGLTMQNHYNTLVDIIKEDSTEITNVFAFYQGVGKTYIFRPERDYRYFYTVDNGLQATQPEHQLVKRFHQEVEKIREALKREALIDQAQANLIEGSLAPEIVANNPQGEELKLSSLKGNYVLIDFWAAWCKPCRMQNPLLVQLYDDFKSKKFEIFSVSLDGINRQPLPKDEWTQAIVSDNLHWTNHVSDLKGFESEVILAYGIETIPYNVFIDKEGKIIGKNWTLIQVRDYLKSH